MLGTLVPLGIEKGKAFRPDARQQKILTDWPYYTETTDTRPQANTDETFILY